MSGTDENARWQGGQDAGVEKSLYIFIINNKRNAVKAKVIKLRQSWHLQIEDFDRFATFIARLFLDFAPPEIRARFMGAPSAIPREATDLAEILLLLYVTAEEQNKVTDAKYSLTALWQVAVQLAGGA
jgi:hypothetical protein